MKPFAEIKNTGELIGWDLSDYMLSIQHYTAQELKDLHSMLIVANAEVGVGKSALINQYITEFSESVFNKDNPEHIKILSELVTISVYEQELITKVKLCQNYEYLRVPECFKH